MQRVTGIGGIFFQSPDPSALRAWYARHLGIAVEPWGGAALTTADATTTLWSIAPTSDAHFAPGRAPFMSNYRVADLRALVALLRAEGCTFHGDVEESDYGLFAWVIDPDGNKVELWQPPAA